VQQSHPELGILASKDFLRYFYSRESARFSIPWGDILKVHHRGDPVEPRARKAIVDVTETNLNEIPERPERSRPFNRNSRLRFIYVIIAVVGARETREKSESEIIEDDEIIRIAHLFIRNVSSSLSCLSITDSSTKLESYITSISMAQYRPISLKRRHYYTV